MCVVVFDLYDAFGMMISVSIKARINYKLLLIYSDLCNFVLILCIFVNIHNKNRIL